VREVIDNHYRAYEEAEMEEKRKTEKRSNKIRTDKERIQRLTEENEDLREECALLRGRLMLLMERLQE
jgi:hypothetical protein